MGAGAAAGWLAAAKAANSSADNSPLPSASMLVNCSGVIVV
jgi:hypothetical protein